MTPTRRTRERIRWALWVGLLLSIPVTSFPYFPLPQAFGEALVRPLALYPLGALLMMEVLVPEPPRRKWPRVLAPILAFAAVATAVTALALLDPALPIRDQAPLARAARGEITLAIGLGFLFMTWRMAATPERIRASLRWLLIGLAVSVGWGLLQGSRLVFRWPYYAPLNAVQRLISTWDLNPYRVSGLTYEPSWFADQLVVLLFPALLASLLSGSRLLVRRTGGWLAEAALFGAGLICLALSYSRGGALTFAVSTVLGLGVALLSGWLHLRGTPTSRATRPDAGRRNWRKLALRTALVLAVAVPLAAILGTLASRNEYFALLWQSLGKLQDLPAYFLSLGASTRYALAVSAWEVFRAHPLAGVGLGQSGFYLFDHIPNWALDRNPEMAFLLAPGSWTFPNPKNLWVRLLAETGIVGSVFFLVFLLLLAAGSLSLLSRRSPFQRLIGLYGVISGPAILLSGTSLDSFALPTLWIALGIVASGIHVFTAGGDPQEAEPPPRVPATIR